MLCQPPAARPSELQLQVVLKALKSDGWALQWASEELRRDKDVIFKALKKEVRSLQFVAEDLLSDRDFCLEAISKNGLAYEFADPEVKADREVARAAVCQDGLALEFVPEQFQSDPELVLKAVQNCGLALRFASPELRGNKGLVLTAAKQDSSAFKFASQELQQNRDVWLQVCPSRLGHWQNRNEVLQEVEKEGLLLQLANQRLVSQPEVMFKAAVKDHHTLQHASPEICADVDFVLRLIKEDVRALTYAADEIRADREVALKATAIDGSSLQFFTQELCEDREVVLTAVRHTGTALAFAAPELRADREVVLAAMAQSRTALLFAAEELRRDKAMWLYNGEEPPVFDPPPEEEQEAYGLRKITGTTYWPYGTGRDWFFVGDLDYMHGRRTPKAERLQDAPRAVSWPPLRKKRGHPQDMVFSQASIRSMTSTVGVPSVPGVFGGKSQQPRLSIRTLERWRSLNEATFGEMTGGGELERWRTPERVACHLHCIRNRRPGQLLRAKCAVVQVLILQGAVRRLSAALESSDSEFQLIGSAQSSSVRTGAPASHASGELPTASTAGHPAESSDLGQSVCIGVPSRGDVIAVCSAAGLYLRETPLLRGAEVLVTAVLVREQEGKLIMAVPSSAWHRKVTKRTLPRGFMSRVGAAEVAACVSTDRRDVLEAVVVRVWLGLVDPQAEASISVPDELPEDCIGFGRSETGEELLPFVPALVAASNEHFTFASAESAKSGAEKDVLLQRIARLEEAVLTFTGGTPATSSAKAPKARPKKAAQLKAGTGGGSGASSAVLDPSVTAAARAAGVSEAALAEMEGLLKRGRTARFKDEPRASADIGGLGLEESEEEEGGVGDDGTEDPLALPGTGTVTKQGSQAEAFAAAMFRMMEGYQKNASRSGSSLERALDGAGGGSGEASSLPSARRNSAARKALRDALASSPAEISAVIEGLMSEEQDLFVSHNGLGFLDHGGGFRLSEVAPPFHAYRQHEHHHTGQVYSRLLDPRWAEVAIAHLKDQAEFIDKRARLTKNPSPVPPSDNAQEAHLQVSRPIRRVRVWCLVGTNVLYMAVPCWKLKSISLAVACLSWLHLGKPAACPPEIRLGTPLNKHQKLCVQRLEAAMFGTRFPFEFSAADFGRHAAKVESQTDVLAALGRAAESLSREWGYLSSGEGFRLGDAARQRSRLEPTAEPWTSNEPLLRGPAPTVARPIIADRIKLPGPPRFKPQKFMDERTAARYNDPLSFAKHPAECPAPPKVKVLAAVQEKLKLYRALADSQRLVPALEPPERAGFGAGLFAVGKDESRDRLILDARPGNGLEQGADLKDCFYQFVATPSRITRLSPELRGELAALALLGPLCAVNLRAPVDSMITATECELPGGDVYQALPLYCGLAVVPRYRELWKREYGGKAATSAAGFGVDGDEFDQNQLLELAGEEERRGALPQFQHPLPTYLCLCPRAASCAMALYPTFQSSDKPEGVAHMAPTTWRKVLRDNSLARWFSDVKTLCAELGIGYAIDCPDSSFWWLQNGWANEADRASPHTWRLDLCRLGAPWRKRSRIATNTSLAGARLLCSGSGHRRLFGFSCAHQRSWTIVAQNRPRGYETTVAMALAAYAGWTSERPLDRAACAKIPNCCRIGEASHPGPRPSAAINRSLDLESQPLYSRVSESLGLRAWASFLAWCSRSLSFDPEPVFVSCPALMAMALRSYGNWLFQSGGSLQTLRYAILAGQRLSWNVRGQLGPAWELVSRWERQQPVKHRTPAFAGGLAPLSLLFMGWRESGRGGAKIQHLRVDEPIAVKILSEVFCQLEGDEKLYPFSPAAY
ncbi:unnamed protein product, partial [Symbiodinium necroappetens]